MLLTAWQIEPTRALPTVSAAPLMTPGQRDRVHAVREDLSAFYDGEVWIEGTQVARDGTPLGRMQALVTLERVRIVRSGQS